MVEEDLHQRLQWMVKPQDLLWDCAAKRDKQEAEGKAVHASHELQQQQQESQTRLEELQQRSSVQLQDTKDSSEEKMEGYCNNFR